MCRWLVYEPADRGRHVCLSPDWADQLSRGGWPAVHWSTVGDPKASDSDIMAWARANKYVVFTHDLDFGTLLALTHESGPSVVQIRAQDVLPERLDPTLFAALKQHELDLEAGALVAVDETRSRVRVLPI